MDNIGQLIQELAGIVRDNNTLAYNAVSATCLLLYEIILTFPDEVRYIWLSPWSLVTILHILIRYFALGLLIVSSYVSIDTNLSVSFCNSLVVFEIWAPLVLVPAVDILILLRVSALYKQSKAMGAFLILLWLAETTIILVLTRFGFGPQTGASPNRLPGVLTNCDPTDPFNIDKFIIGGSVAMGFQTIYLGLALYKLAVQVKSFRRLTPLLEIFLRDGAVYCFNVLAMYAVGVFFARHFGPSSLEGLGSVWLVSIVAITAGRLVLNLKSSVHHDSSDYASNLSAVEQVGSYGSGFEVPMGPIQSSVIIDTSRIHGGTGVELLPISDGTVVLVQN